MYANVETAAKEICQLFVDAWKENGVSLPAAFPNSKFKLSDMNASSMWARWSLQHAIRDQATLANVDGKRRWRSSGLVTVETYTAIGKGVIAPYQAAQKVVNAYEGQRTPGDAWFRNVRMIEIGETSELWFRIDVYADFEYDILA